MSILAGICGTPTQNKPAYRASDDAYLAKAMECDNLINLGTDRLNKLMGAAITIATIKPTSPDGLMMARAHLAEAMSDLDVSDEDALANTAGLESEGCDAGLEAWSSIKEYVASIIDWLQKQWTKFRRFIMKYWNKFFGDVERLEKSWTSVRDEAKTKQSGYTLDKSAKGEFDKQADCFFGKGNDADAKLTADDLVDSANQYREITSIMLDKVIPLEVVNLTSEELLNEEGLLIGAWMLGREVDQKDLLQLGSKHFRDVVSEMTVKQREGAPTKANAHLVSRSGVLAGRKRLYMAGRIGLLGKNRSIGLLKGINDTDQIRVSDVFVNDATAKQTKKPKAIISYTSADVIEEIADANLELLTEVKAIQRSKVLEKCGDEIDKASKGLDGWKKNVPDNDTSPEVRAAFREAVKIATEMFSLQRRVKINAPLSVCTNARLVSAAHLDYAKQSLKALKKDK